MAMDIDMDKKRKIAIAIAAKNKRLFPYDKYGAGYFLRGSAESLSSFGPSYKEASDFQKQNRKQSGFVGRGLYQGRGKIRFKDIESVGHRFLTKGIPNIIKAGSAIKGFLGRGMYEGRGLVRRNPQRMNEIMEGGMSNSAHISSAGDETGSIMISNREYVGDIFAPATTGTFHVTPFPLNPGLEQTFPWLSQLAANYEEYEFIQLVFEFNSSIQDVNSSNGQVGTIITATNYNASQPLFTDKPQMAAYYGSVSGKTTDDQTHGVECDPKKKSGSAGSYVRTNPVLTGEDLKAYDHGIFQLATHNIPTAMLNGTLGELYVTYKILLRKPKFLTARGLAITRSIYVSGGSESNTLPFGTQALLLSGQQNNLAVLVTIASNSLKLTFPAYYAGNLEILMFVEASALLAGQLTSSQSFTGQVSNVGDLYGVGQGSSDAPIHINQLLQTTGANLIHHIKVQPATNATDNSVTYTLGLSAGTITQSMIIIQEYNTSFNRADGSPVLVNSGGTVVVP